MRVQVNCLDKVDRNDSKKPYIVSLQEKSGVAGCEEWKLKKGIGCSLRFCSSDSLLPCSLHSLGCRQRWETQEQREAVNLPIPGTSAYVT